MITDSLRMLFKRDLTKLRSEIESYKNEDKIWHVEKGIANSAGNLCLHLIGNLNTYLGAALGNTNYIRERDLEFSLKDVPRADLLAKIDATLIVVDHALSCVSDNDLGKDFPVTLWETATSMDYTLIHLATHLSYHLGQINYHRRLLEGEN